MIFKWNNKEYKLILLMMSGSRLYGNSTQESDYDYRGIFVESIKDKLSIESKCEKIQTNVGEFELSDYLISLGLNIQRTDDIHLYELSKFVNLSIKNNPNIMDLLCSDKSKAIYATEEGEKLLDCKHLFLCSKVKHEFSGYAFSQMKKMTSHHKMLSRYPKVNDITEILKDHYKNNELDFDFIANNFSGQLAEFITKETPQNKKKLSNCIEYDFLEESYKDIDWKMYRRPRMIDYASAYTLQHSKLDLDMNLYELIDDTLDVELSLKDFIQSKASFRLFSNTMISVYTEGQGIFGAEGKLKCNESTNIGKFVCLLKLDAQNHKKDVDAIKKLWDWKAHRNEKRNTLEEMYGYDTKHASHLVRLLIKCREILSSGIYTPKLNSKELQLVRDVRAGKYSYDEIIKMSYDIDNECSELYKTTALQHNPKRKDIDKLLYSLYITNFKSPLR